MDDETFAIRWTLYKGKYQGSPVAIKQLLLPVSCFKDLQKKIPHLIVLSHPNLVELVGFAQIPQNVRLEVTQKEPSEQSLTQGERPTNDDQPSEERAEGTLPSPTPFSSKGIEICLIYRWTRPQSLFSLIVEQSKTGKKMRWKTKSSVAREIAVGMHYLHACNIVHGHLHPTNCLMNKVYGLPLVKLIDFGLLTKAKCGKPQTTRASFAPEVLMEQTTTLTKAADVFSFGMLLFQLITNSPETPLRTRSSNYWWTPSQIKEECDKRKTETAVVFDLASREGFFLNTLPPEMICWIAEFVTRSAWQIPSDIPQELWELTCKCCEYNPKKRPTFEDILESFGRRPNMPKRSRGVHCFAPMLNLFKK